MDFDDVSLQKYGQFIKQSLSSLSVEFPMGGIRKCHKFTCKAIWLLFILMMFYCKSMVSSQYNRHVHQLSSLQGSSEICQIHFFFIGTLFKANGSYYLLQLYDFYLKIYCIRNFCCQNVLSLIYVYFCPQIHQCTRI